MAEIRHIAQVSLGFDSIPLPELLADFFGGSLVSGVHNGHIGAQ